MSNQLQLESLAPKHFEQVIALGNDVHGDGYLDIPMLEQMLVKSKKDGINASLVMVDSQHPTQPNKVVGFRLTYAPTQWNIDQWYSPELWQVPKDQVCYFKCNTVDENYRGHGIARKLLETSCERVKQQGGKAGVCHTWLQSPGNAAYHYFTKCGGEFIKKHPNRWYQDSLDGYDCIVCEAHCHCDAAEMILRF